MFLWPFSAVSVAQPHSFSFVLDAGRPLSSGDSGQTGLLPSGVDSCQRAGLCPRLRCGRFLLAVMHSHHPSPGGLPPLISMPKPVTSCSSDCDCASSSGFRWPRSLVLSIDSPLEGRHRNMRRSLTSCPRCRLQYETRQKATDRMEAGALNSCFCELLWVWGCLRRPVDLQRGVIDFHLYTLHSPLTVLRCIIWFVEFQI